MEKLACVCDPSASVSGHGALTKAGLSLQGLATADHTTLLLNCYTKAKDVDKLDRFLKGAERQGATGSLPFSIDTAVKVGAQHPVGVSKSYAAQNVIARTDTPTALLCQINRFNSE